MNDLMSAGLHRVWKDALVAALRPAAATGRSATSTSPAAPATSRSASSTPAGRRRHVTVLDINGDMLAVGRERARLALRGPDRFRRGATPRRCRFADQALRRLHDRLRHPQRAAHRRGARARPIACCRPGGRFLCLEFSQVDVPGLDADLRRLFVQRHPGARPDGDAATRESYRYLVEFDPPFPPPAAFARMIEEAGFRRVTHRP